MKCLVVSAHPLENSLCAHLTGHVVDTLKNSGHQVVEEDLYAQHFDPVLSAVERGSYYKDSYDIGAIADQTKRLIEAEALILVFPTWWFSFPAILKGWFDRVWGPGIAYDHADDFGPIKPRLDNLRSVMVVTTLGAPWWVDYLVMRRPVRKVVKIALLGACARKSSLEYLSLYKSENVEPGKVKRFKEKVSRKLEKLR